jgi:hypothetical protein
MRSIDGPDEVNSQTIAKLELAKHARMSSNTDPVY